MTKKIKDEDAEATFTQRVLMSLVNDVQAMVENAERTKVQVYAMAKANGVYIPPEE